MVDQEFLGRLDREIASLKQRIESRKSLPQDDRVPAGEHPLAPNLLQEAVSRLRHLEEMRQQIIDQSFGG
jgi:hypothetical protein